MRYINRLFTYLLTVGLKLNADDDDDDDDDDADAVQQCIVRYVVMWCSC